LKYEKRIREFLPSIDPFVCTDLSEPFIYVAAVGFEDRCFGFLKEALKHGVKPAKVIAIEYEPVELPNRKTEFMDLVKQLHVSDENVMWMTYKRTFPSEFERTIESVNKIFSQYSTTLVDISSMSKLLILQLLQGLRFMQINVRIIYAEAASYYPSEPEYKQAKLKIQRSIPEFLSTGIYDVVTTYSLSSVAMQGYPTALVGFPSFNQNLLLAAIEEATPQDLIIFEGIPHNRENLWRAKAIAELNSASYRYQSKPPIAVSTFDYIETVEKLMDIYREYQYTHRFVVAPANSKLQTVSIFFFKRMHPDVHIIYPTPRGFFKLHTDGVEDMWQISVDRFSEFLGSLQEASQRYLVSMNPR